MTLYQLNEDVKNPIHDRRCKHGFEGIETFKAGYKFVYDHVNPTYSDGMPKDAKTLSGKFIPPAVFRVLLPVAQVVKVQTFTEHKAMSRASSLDIEADVLEELWQRPEFKDAIKGALEAVMNRLDAE